MLRVAVATIEGPPTDLRVWSGIPANVIDALRTLADIEVEALGPVGQRSVVLGRVVSSATRRTPMGRLSWEVEPAMARHLGSALRRELSRIPPVDAVLTLGWAPQRVPGLPPLVFWGDASIAQRVDDAPHWSSLSKRSRRLVEPTEGRMLQSLDAVVMPSRWAADDVVRRYGLPPERVHVVPFGSNLPLPPAVERGPVPRPLRLLTVGVAWHRKGVDRSVAIADELVARGHDVELDVVGVLPPDGSWRRPHVTYHGFIDTSTADGRQRLATIYRQASVFLLPSRHDPFPIVLGEAASYSLPAIVTRVGGVPDRVRDEVSGVVLDPSADASTFADEVERLISDPRRYADLAGGARTHFVESFRWESSATRVVDILRAVSR